MLRTTLLITVCLFAPALASAQTRPKAPAREDTPAGAAAGQAGPELLRRFAEGDEGAFIDGVRAADARAVEWMLTRGADPDAATAGHTPALVLAAKSGSVELVRLLLEAGAKIDADDDNSYAALHYAAQSGNVEMVGLLLARGADVNKLGYDDHTVLMFASHGANWILTPKPLQEFFLREGEDEDDEEDESLVPKHLGAVEDYRKVFARLIAAGAKVNVVADCGETALTAATCDAELVRMLLAAGARADYGAPLCLLEEVESGKFVKELVSNVEDGKRKEELTRAAREWAAQTSNERREVVRLLVAAGATRGDCGDEEEETGGEESMP
jgi:hypothetical protein